MGFEESMVDEPIAVKEAYAIWYSMLHFRDYLRNTECTIYCDNQTVCWAFIKEKSNNRKVKNIVIDILRLAKKLNCDIEIVWTPTGIQLADKPSREVSLNEEFLPHPTFELLERNAGFKADVDCMASDTNYKCAKYIKWRDDKIKFRKCIGINFFHVNPKKLFNQNLYIFPPKNCVVKTANFIFRLYERNNFIFIFHVFAELPLGCERLLSLPHARLEKLTEKQAITFFPSEKKVTLQVPYQGKYVLLGTPNIRPKAIYAIINTPNKSRLKQNRKRKLFQPCKITQVKNNIK